MAFPLLQHEWWFCQDPDCRKPDRVYGLRAQSMAHLWLQQLKDDPVRMHPLQDLVRNNISLPLFHVGDATLANRIEELLMAGRLHLHKIEREVKWARQEKAVPFPLSDHQSRAASPPPPVNDPPSFSSKVNLSAQAAALVAAAASGTPFCLE